jgi:hypothetical protein
MAPKLQPKLPNERRNVYIPEIHWRLWRSKATLAGISISEYIVAAMTAALGKGRK